MLLKQFGDFDAQHFMNHFPKVAKIAPQKTFYEFVKIKYIKKFGMSSMQGNRNQKY